jgi:hypothetical protein
MPTNVDPNYLHQMQMMQQQAMQAQQRFQFDQMQQQMNAYRMVERYGLSMTNYSNLYPHTMVPAYTGTQVRIEEDLSKPYQAVLKEQATNIEKMAAIVDEIKAAADQAEAVNKATIAAHEWKPAFTETPYEKECREADRLKRQLAQERAMRNMQHDMDAEDRKSFEKNQKDLADSQTLGEAFSRPIHRPIRYAMLGGRDFFNKDGV